MMVHRGRRRRVDGCAPRGIGRWSRVRVEKPREGDVDVGLGARVRRRRRGRRPRAHLSVVSPRDPTRKVKLCAKSRVVRH